MAICRSCGAEMEPGARFCQNCGADTFAPEAQQPEQPPAFTPPPLQVQPPQSYQQPPYQQGYQPPYGAPPNPPELAPVLTTSQVLGMFAITLIPVAGLVMMLIWAFSSTENPNKQALARGYLLFYLIVIGAILVITLIAGISCASCLGNWAQQYYYYYGY